MDIEKHYILQNGLYSTLPHISMFIIANFASNLIDKLRKKRVVSTVAARKIAMGIGKLVLFIALCAVFSSKRLIFWQLTLIPLYIHPHCNCRNFSFIHKYVIDPFYSSLELLPLFSVRPTQVVGIVHASGSNLI